MVIKMFVGGLRPSIQESELLDYFSSFGKIDKVDIIKDKSTNIPRGFAFIYFKERSSMNRALEKTHYLDGRRTDCKEALNKEDAKDYLTKERTHKIFIGGLSQKTEEESLYEYYKHYGEIYKAYLIYDHKTHQSRCFGFVEFETSDAVERVLAKKKHFIDGTQVECKPVFLKSELKDLGSFEGSKKKFPRQGGKTRKYREKDPQPEKTNSKEKELISEKDKKILENNKKSKKNGKGKKSDQNCKANTTSTQTSSVTTMPSQLEVPHFIPPQATPQTQLAAPSQPLNN